MIITPFWDNVDDLDLLSPNERITVSGVSQKRKLISATWDHSPYIHTAIVPQEFYLLRLVEDAGPHSLRLTEVQFGKQKHVNGFQSHS